MWYNFNIKKEGIFAMNTDAENVKHAKESFNSILGNKKYAGIIR